MINAIMKAIQSSTCAGRLVQATDYYPFGMKYNTQVNVSGENNYLYNNKELQNELNFDWYDYGARFYDQQIGGGIEAIGYNYVQEPKGYMRLSKNDVQRHIIDH